MFSGQSFVAGRPVGSGYAPSWAPRSVRDIPPHARFRAFFLWAKGGAFPRALPASPRTWVRGAFRSGRGIQTVTTGLLAVFLSVPMFHVEQSRIRQEGAPANVPRGTFNRAHLQQNQDTKIQDTPQERVDTPQKQQCRCGTTPLYIDIKPVNWALSQKNTTYCPFQNRLGCAIITGTALFCAAERRRAGEERPFLRLQRPKDDSKPWLHT